MPPATIPHAAPLPPILSLVVARGRNGVIGRDGTLPWRVPSDLKHFRAVTMGRPVLMGRRTWDSIGRALPGRDNLVLTRATDRTTPRGWCFSDLWAMVAAGRAMAAVRGSDEVCVIGGAQIYEALMGVAARIHLTELDLAPEGDAWFKLPGAGWHEVARTRFEPAEGDECGGAYVTLERLP